MSLTFRRPTAPLAPLARAHRTLCGLVLCGLAALAAPRADAQEGPPATESPAPEGAPPEGPPVAAQLAPWTTPLPVEIAVRDAIVAPLDRRLNPRLSSYEDLHRFQMRSLAAGLGGAVVAGAAVGGSYLAFQGDRPALGGGLAALSAAGFTVVAGGWVGFHWSSHEAWERVGRDAGVHPAWGLWAARLRVLSLPLGLLALSDLNGADVPVTVVATAAAVATGVTVVQTNQAARAQGLLKPGLSVQLGPALLPSGRGEGGAQAGLLLRGAW